MSIAQYLLDKWNGLAPEERDTWPLKGQYMKERYLHDLNLGGIWTVEFDKVDGTPTVMDITLDPRIVPPTPVVEGKAPPTPRPEQPHLIHVYSTDRAGWRSFTVANVKALYPKR